jgi:hypothetical protein
MITLEDCVGLCGLTEDEVLAIARHEHLPEMVAVELGSYLVDTAAEQDAIRAMIEEDIEAARGARDTGRTLALKVVLHKFICEHPPQ